MLLDTLGVSFLGNLLTGKGTIRAGQDFWCHLILNTKIQKYYQNEPKFNDVY